MNIEYNVYSDGSKSLDTNERCGVEIFYPGEHNLPASAKSKRIRVLRGIMNLAGHEDVLPAVDWSPQCDPLLVPADVPLRFLNTDLLYCYYEYR